MEDSDWLALGDRVEVVVDPAAWVAPMTPDEIAGRWSDWIAAGVGLLLVVITSVITARGEP